MVYQKFNYLFKKNYSLKKKRLPIPLPPYSALINGCFKDASKFKSGESDKEVIAI